MKIASSLKSLKKRDLNSKLVKRRGKLYVINKKISFVRFACHYDEIFGLRDCIRWLSQNRVSVFINIMQISEINLDKLKKDLPEAKI